MHMQADLVSCNCTSWPSSTWLPPSKTPPLQTQVLLHTSSTPACVLPPLLAATSNSIGPFLLASCCSSRAPAEAGNTSLSAARLMPRAAADAMSAGAAESCRCRATPRLSSSSCCSRSSSCVCAVTPPAASNQSTDRLHAYCWEEQSNCQVDPPHPSLMLTAAAAAAASSRR